MRGDGRYLVARHTKGEHARGWLLEQVEGEHKRELSGWSLEQVEGEHKRGLLREQGKRSSRGYEKERA